MDFSQTTNILLWFAFKLYLCTATLFASYIQSKLWFAFKLYLCTARLSFFLIGLQLWFAFKLYLCTASSLRRSYFTGCGLLSNCIFAQLSHEKCLSEYSCGLLSNCIFAQLQRISNNEQEVVVCFQIVSLHSIAIRL